MSNEINHFGGVTIRVVGEGNLRPTFKGFDAIESVALVPLVMVPTNRKEPTRLGNYSSQRALLRLEVTAINEWFKVNNFTIWAKPLWTSWPSGGGDS